MSRRSYQLPSHLDQALAKHAEARRTTRSEVVRDALSAYLMIEGASHRANIELDALRDELRAGLRSLKELITHRPSTPQQVGTPDAGDRVRARFELIDHQEKQHGNGNR
jgi:Arc/MetJ-type ribon-helix-helix transcriptional regulator